MFWYSTTCKCRNITTVGICSTFVFRNALSRSVYQRYYCFFRTVTVICAIKHQRLLLVLSTFHCFKHSTMIEIVSFGVLLAAASYYILRGPDLCDTYRKFDIYQLKGKIHSHVYGQHIASDMVPRELSRYFETYHLYYQPLFLAFHGGFGVGKNYMAEMILDFFPQKTKILFTAELDFPHEHLAGKYAKDVERRIASTVSECHVNVIIFDEVDRISDVVMAGVHSALKRLQEKKKMPVIILLLSNGNSQDINNVVFTNKLQRESLNLHNFEFIQNGERWYSSEKWMNTKVVFVPFLPLDKGHVTQCIWDDLRLKRIKSSPKIIEDVIEELTFHSQNGFSYSATGCKRVSEKVDLVTL
ncbi:torsin-1A-like [Gigantopelta aegis]|uniref:torsin-1A-like n=1 Tax=Gigantopelta aegis TaxID=1735272 RepID=UPI001B8881E1|nr:torsin-1A-like [Gigantopelta aegis]